MSHPQGIMDAPERKRLPAILAGRGGTGVVAVKGGRQGEQNEVGTTGTFPVSYFVMQHIRVATQHSFRNTAPCAAKTQEHIPSL